MKEIYALISDLNIYSISLFNVGEDFTCQTMVACEFLRMSGVYGNMAAINLYFALILLLALDNVLQSVLLQVGFHPRQGGYAYVRRHILFQIALSENHVSFRNSNSNRMITF